MPPLVSKPQVGWIFPFLSFGICRMKRRRIKGLKPPEQTCLALISLLSGTERQKECSKPELLLALMRHKYQLWSSREIPSYCHCHLFSSQLSFFLQERLDWVVRLGAIHGFHSSPEAPTPRVLWGSVCPQAEDRSDPAQLRHEGSHRPQHSSESLQHGCPSCPPKPP